MIYQKLQSGKQVGTDNRIDKSGVFYWYSYAVQKVDDYYVVYECEIAEDILLICKSFFAEDNIDSFRQGLGNNDEI